MLIISPYAQKLRNGKPNAKDYPYWPELIQLIQTNITSDIVQVGIDGEIPLVDDCRFNLPIKELINLIHQCTIWISVDSMFQHLAWDCGKQGIVLFSQSDPLIFGHPSNINLLKNRIYLRQNQFLWWEDVEIIEDSYFEPDKIIKHINQFY
jgi:ADP-heptose:LPS heptosyltransferase